MADFAQNLELKVQCAPAVLDSIQRRVASLVCSPIQRLNQVDTYFRVVRGRLKLREIRSQSEPARIDRAEIIAYTRPMDDGSRWSSYQVVPIAAQRRTGPVQQHADDA